MTEKTKQTAEVTGIKGMVIYADAGVRPTNPGFGGCGFHGYHFDTSTPIKQSIGLGSTLATTQGYFDKKEGVAADPKNIQKQLDKGVNVLVQPLLFVDSSSTVPPPATNNFCEPSAMVAALEYVFLHDVVWANIITDSQYTVNGAMNWIDGWQRNNWIKTDGSPVSNTEIWKKYLAIRDALRLKGVDFRVSWVRSHNGEPGNEAADKLATMGVFRSQRGVHESFLREAEVDGYWKRNDDRHPFLAHRRCYFNTLPDSIKQGEYFLGDHGKDDEHMGKRMGDASLAVVVLDKPDTTLEVVRATQTKHNGGADALYITYLDAVYNPEVSRYLNMYREHSLEPVSSYCQDLRYLDKTPITREKNPARLSARSVEVLEELYRMLVRFTEADESLVLTDITSTLYETTEKVVKAKKGETGDTTQTNMKLRPEFVVGIPKVDVVAKHPFGGETPLVLSTGLDILDRNSLKRLESLNPTVYVVTWTDGDKAYRYATIIKASGSMGIWVANNSNIKLHV